MGLIWKRLIGKQKYSITGQTNENIKRLRNLQKKIRRNWKSKCN